MTARTHQAIRARIFERIRAGEWPLGARIPDETAFAAEFGCARSTVNRALRSLAEEGVVERRRKGGTRVAPLPVRTARLRIPLIREQIESAGAVYAATILARAVRAVPPDLAALFGNRADWLETLHSADGKPFALERRWVNSAAVPAFAAADLAAINANEWLVKSVPFSRGELKLYATGADPAAAEYLRTAVGAPLLAMERTTWREHTALTRVTLLHPPGHTMDLGI